MFDFSKFSVLGGLMKGKNPLQAMSPFFGVLPTLLMAGRNNNNNSAPAQRPAMTLEEMKRRRAAAAGGNYPMAQ